MKKDIESGQVFVLNQSVMQLNRKLQAAKMLLREWRSKEILPELNKDLVQRTDKVIMEAA